MFKVALFFSTIGNENLKFNHVLIPSLPVFLSTHHVLQQGLWHGFPSAEFVSPQPWTEAFPLNGWEESPAQPYV
jgi:hypothetical protein